MNLSIIPRLYNSLSRMAQVGLVVSVSAVLIIISVIGIRSGGTPTASIKVTRGSLSQVVSVTGRMKPVQEVELAFQNSGRVASVNATIGARVVAGQLLASLNTAELNAQLRDAQANVLAQQAKLNDIQSGGRAEEIAIKESELKSAQQTLDNAYANVYDVLSDAYTKTDNAMRIQLLPMFSSFGSSVTPLFSLTFSCQCDAQAQSAASLRGQAEIGLNTWKQELANLVANGTPEAYVNAIHDARGFLQSAKDTIAAVDVLLNDTSISITSSLVETYRVNNSTARASVVAAATEVNTQDQLITTDEIAVERAQNDLALTKAGSTPDEIDAQRALLLSAQAQVDRIQALLGASVIRSPIKGVVTKVDAKVGQTAAASQTLIGVISDQQLEIEANVPEVDIGNVMVGNAVQVTVDALPGQTLTANVTFIDPAETIIDGVVNFRVLMLLDEPNTQLKSGLTVNLNIETVHKDGVLLLPQFAVIENDQGTFVMKLVNGKPVQMPVTLGIRGPDGTVEIISGLNEGDQVQNIGLK
jgi:HlyD family secretion protein